MRLMDTSKVGTDSVRHFLSREQACRFDDVALAVNPLRLNPIEPGTLAGQVEGDDAHAGVVLSDRTIVGSDPGAHLVEGGAMTLVERRMPAGNW
jgi:hypothetical protein